MYNAIRVCDPPSFDPQIWCKIFLSCIMLPPSFKVEINHFYFISKEKQSVNINTCIRILQEKNPLITSLPQFETFLFLNSHLLFKDYDSLMPSITLLQLCKGLRSPRCEAVCLSDS